MRSRIIVRTLVLGVMALMSLVMAQEKEMAITTSSPEAMKHFLEGREMLEFNDVMKAIYAFDRALKADPDFAMAHLYRYSCGVGSVNKRQVHLDKAAALREQVSEGERLLITYSLVAQNRDIGKQRVLVGQLLKLLPNDKRILNLAGGFYHYTEGDYAKAVPYFEKAVQLDSNYPAVYNNLGYCHLAMNNYEAAENAFKRQIELIPDQANPYDSYAELLQKMGRYNDSIVQYQMALEVDPSFALALSGIGGNYLLMKDYDRAGEYYRHWFDQTQFIDHRFTALDKLIGIHILKGEIDEALRTNERYLALAVAHDRCTNVCGAHIGDGFILGVAGKTDQALTCLEKARVLANNSDLPDAMKMQLCRICRYSGCLALLDGHRTEEAIKAIEAMREEVKRQERTGDVQRMQLLDGIVSAQQGAYEKALAHYTKSWPDAAIVKWYQSEAYRQMGQQTEADRLLEEIRQANETSFEAALVSYRMGKRAM